jgi:hypothetical protein
MKQPQLRALTPTPICLEMNQRSPAALMRPMATSRRTPHRLHATSKTRSAITWPRCGPRWKRLRTDTRSAELNRIGFRLYEKFRPEIPPGSSGWGAKAAAGDREYPLRDLTTPARGSHRQRGRRYAVYASVNTDVHILVHRFCGPNAGYPSADRS